MSSTSVVALVGVSVVLLCACGRVDFTPLRDAAGAIDADASMDPSLIAHYRLDDDPGDGVLDSTDNAHDGVCDSTCPTLATGVLGGAYSLNGSTDMIAVADMPALRPPALTVSLWFAKRSNGGACIFQKVLGTGLSDSWQIGTSTDNGLEICTSGSGGSCDASVGGLWTLDAWHHAVLVETGARHVAYFDGVPVIDAPVGAIAYDDRPITLGADLDNGLLNCPFSGRLDDVRIYNRALDPSEIAALAAQR